MHFYLPFPTYFTLETKGEFVTTRAEKGAEDNFLNRFFEKRGFLKYLSYKEYRKSIKS